jgi:hypothetical protein
MQEQAELGESKPKQEEGQDDRGAVDPAGTQYLIKVVVTDGFNSSQDVSNATFMVSNGSSIYLPFITK